MIYDRSELKEILKNIKEDGFIVPTDLDVLELALDMMVFIGDPDSELRDGLIYEIFCSWITTNIFTEDQLKQILEISLGEDYLFYNIGENGGDSVFTRSFSALLIAVILYQHRRDSFLSEGDIADITNKIIRYMKEEKDVRGFVEEKGWAHSTAHGADVINELSQCSSVEDAKLMDLLQVIKEKVSIDSCVYVCQEDERLALPATNIIKLNILDNWEIMSWINSFKNFDRPSPDTFPHKLNIKINIKNFLRGLYFRLMEVEGTEEIRRRIEANLKEIIGY